MANSNPLGQAGDTHYGVWPTTEHRGSYYPIWESWKNTSLHWLDLPIFQEKPKSQMFKYEILQLINAKSNSKS